MAKTIEELRVDIPFAPHASAKYVWQELMNRGWDIRVLRSELDKLYVLTVAEKADQSFLLSEVQHLLYTPLNDRQSYFLTANKSRTKSLLEDVGLSYPKNIFEITKDQLHALAGFEVSTKLAVKPHASYGGKGVTIVTDTTQLMPSVEKALIYSEIALVQEYAEGDEHRLLFVDGVFAAAFRCRPACIKGDGKLSVRQHIDAKNEAKSKTDYLGTRSKIKLARAEEFMGAKGIDWVPECGELVVLDTISNISFGGDAIDATDNVSAILKEKVSQLCRTASLGVVGVDVISPDISSNILEVHKITEINGCPGLRPHLLVEEGLSRNVAVPYVDALEKYSQLRYNPLWKALTN
jgi:cyanophycin synthetase